MYTSLSLNQLKRDIAYEARWHVELEDELAALDARLAQFMAQLDAAQVALLDEDGRVVSPEVQVAGQRAADGARAFCREANVQLQTLVRQTCTVHSENNERFSF